MLFIFSSKHPNSNLTESSFNFIDFVKEFKLQNPEQEIKFVNTNLYITNPELFEARLKEITNKDHLIYIVNKDDKMYSIPILKHLETLELKTRLFFTASIQTLNKTFVDIVGKLNADSWTILSNFKHELFKDFKSFYTDFVRIDLNIPTENETDLFLLDMLEDKDVINTKVSQENLICYINKQKEKETSMDVFTTLGFVPSDTDIKNIILNGVSTFDFSYHPECVIPYAKTVFYPSTHSKLFGRWGYIAHRLKCKVVSDNIHGYQVEKDYQLQGLMEVVKEVFKKE